MPPRANIVLRNRNGRDIRIVVRRRADGQDSYGAFLRRLRIGLRDPGAQAPMPDGEQ